MIIPVANAWLAGAVFSIHLFFLNNILQCEKIKKGMF